jgi:hypothetical protein
VSKLIDTRNGADGSSKSLLSQIPGTTHTIDPGDSVNNISDCYTPAAPDNAQTDPNLVTYSDTVSAEGHPHSALGDTITAEPKSVTCPLCPIGLDGTP